MTPSAPLAIPALVADIGGTNARFALTDLAAPHAQVHHACRFDVTLFDSLQGATSHYLDSVGVRPKHAAFAVACPVDGQTISLTNRAWSFTRDALCQSLDLDHLHVLNDFGAVAWSVPALDHDEQIVLHGDQGPVSHGPVLHGPISVIGPGTGLGVAMLVGDQHRWQVIETEGGHVSFAPLDDEEHAVARWLTACFGRVSNERLLCGSGLSHIDAVLRDVVDVATGKHDALREPAEIVNAALAGRDKIARRSLARFCAVLGSVAGDAALIHGARSVMIAGGIVPRFVPFLRNSAFHERFIAKGRLAAYLESVSIRVITHPGPGLLGAAMALRADFALENSR